MTAQGPKIQLQPMIIAVISAALGALSTWALKIEDRVFQIASRAITKQDIIDIESRCNNSTIRVEQSIEALRRRLEKLNDEFHSKDQKR